MKRRSPGVKSRFTAEEIAHIRDVHNRWQAMRVERIRLCKSLGLRSDLFNRIGSGRLGKNPREAA